MIAPEIRRRLPKARLISFERSRAFYFARFRLANAVRLNIGWFVIVHRAPWLEKSARNLHPQLFAISAGKQADKD